jgi:hypothetical protein
VGFRRLALVSIAPLPHYAAAADPESAEDWRFRPPEVNWKARECGV